MFDFIIGDLVSIGDEYVVIQNNNIGYRVYTSEKSMLDMEIGEKNIMMYTNLIVREDAILLYGFTTEEEVDMFNLLLKVSRIGPKVAIGVLSSLAPNKLKKAVLSDDVAVLTQAPGIGKKTAERLILELKDKIDESEIYIETDLEVDNARVMKKEALEALVSLGYTKYEVDMALKNLDTKDKNVEEIIRLSLKELSK